MAHVFTFSDARFWMDGPRFARPRFAHVLFGWMAHVLAQMAHVFGPRFRPEGSGFLATTRSHISVGQSLITEFACSRDRIYTSLDRQHPSIQIGIIRLLESNKLATIREICICTFAIARFAIE